MKPEDALIQAVEARTALPPLTASIPTLSIPDAYRIQDLVVQARVTAGYPVVGAKLGLTSRAKQQQMGVNEPLYGWLTSDMGRVDELSIGAFIQPRIEPEIGFVLGTDLDGSEVSAADVLDATAAVFPALDVLDSRFTGYQFTIADVVADNASAAAWIQAPGTPLIPGLDLALTGCVLSIDGRIVATAAGAAALGHPAESVAWLVRQLAQRQRGLPAGSIVLSGALTEAFPVDVGMSIRAEFDHIGAVSVRVTP